jgi:cyanophycinase
MLYTNTRHAIILTIALLVFSGASLGSSYHYIHLGHTEDAVTNTTAGIAMMGGGDDIDEAFRWLCQKGGGGDFLVLRARGDDDYNAYVNGLCKTNSVSTLIIPDRESAEDPAVAVIIRHAEAIFIAGGDQARYINFWKGTPVQAAINDQITAARPIGGTSAGLAILGQFAYGALNDKEDDKDLSSQQVLQNPFFDRVTLVRDFLKIPLLQNTITDSHFAKRDRMGRTLGFLARLMQDGWSNDPREVAIDEKSAVLVGADGQATIVGSGQGAYFIHPTQAPKVCRAGTPLTFEAIDIFHAPSRGHFDLTQWSGQGGENYSLTVSQGTIRSSRTGNAIY